MITFLKLIRLHQWVKNLFIFAPLFFSGQFLESNKLLLCICGFLGFGFAASSIYVLNDILDVERDKLHPTKNQRPIASGKISIFNASIIFSILFLMALIFSFFINFYFFIIVIFYLILNVLYSSGLKTISIIDVFIISIGFVLRVAAGGVLTSISVSHWLYIMTFLLALFIAFCKRRDDVLLLNQTGNEMRRSVHGYNLEFISSSISILCAVIIVSYLLYITSSEIQLRFYGKNAYISTIFVILGILRFLQITMVELNSGSPTKILLQDKILQSILVSWVLFFIFIIYIV